MGIPKASRHTVVVLVVLLPATVLLAGCGFANRSFSGLASAPSTEEKAELASLSDQNAMAEEESDVVPAMYEQEQSALPDVTVASVSEGVGHVRLISHSQEAATVGTAVPEPRLPGKVEHIDTNDFTQQVLESDVPVLVDFYADWCGPCRKLAPTLDRIARETPNAKVVKVNIDDSPQVAKRYGVRSIPTVMVFKNGTAVARHTGLADESSLLDMLAQ